jgi:hypothetical protein
MMGLDSPILQGNLEISAVLRILKHSPGPL